MEPRSELAAAAEELHEGHEHLPGTLELDARLIDELGIAETLHAIEAHFTAGDPPLSVYSLISTADLNPRIVKGIAGELWGWHVYNANAAARFLKLYDEPELPAVGGKAPRMRIPLLGASAANVGLSKGVKFPKGIALGLTTGVADGDVGVVAAGEIVVNLFYR